jgi:hypothetical protein
MVPSSRPSPIAMAFTTPMEDAVMEVEAQLVPL